MEGYDQNKGLIPTNTDQKFLELVIPTIESEFTTGISKGPLTLLNLHVDLNSKLNIINLFGAIK